MPKLQIIKQRFGIIGNDPTLNRAIEKAIQVAPTDISVLIRGESGTGKEFIPKIIHALSIRKHKQYIAVNCGAIPEGTIDSELFGHEKGAFTGAITGRKGYFEVADGGTIFLDEVGELPSHTQVRLLRVLENGEFIKVGASKSQITDTRIVAATNMDIINAIENNDFREDLFYRLNTVEIHIPPLRKRKKDIHLLFRKFAVDFGQKYNMPTVQLTEEAIQLIEDYAWPGNIRQLRNFVEQLSVVETKRLIDYTTLKEYLPSNSLLPSVIKKKKNNADFSSDREMLYKVLFDMKQDLNNLRNLTLELLNKDSSKTNENINPELIKEVMSFQKESLPEKQTLTKSATTFINETAEQDNLYDEPEFIDISEQNESLSIQHKEEELIRKALDKHNGKRKYAAEELGISERTLYRKIKQFNIQ